MCVFHILSLYGQEVNKKPVFASDFSFLNLFFFTNKNVFLLLHKYPPLRVGLLRKMSKKLYSSV